MLALGLGAVLYSIFSSLWSTSASDLSSSTPRIQKQNSSDGRPTNINNESQLPSEKSSLPVFLKDGWSKVDAPPPNQKLLDLSPDLLSDHSQEIYQQLSSGAIGPRHIDNMATIFSQTHDEKIRYRILENLGTLNLIKSEQTMLSIYAISTSDEKAMIVGLLHPLDHELSHNFLIQLGNGSKSNEQGLGLTALASVYLFSGNSNFQKHTLSHLNESSKIQFLSIQKKLNSFTWAENKQHHAHESSEGRDSHE